MTKSCKGVFITGTDTGSGKTHVSVGIMTVLKRYGLRVAGMKPVASGCENIEGRPVNEDARKLQSASTTVPDYDLINPWALPDPVSPNIAASRRGIHIVPGPVVDAYRELEKRSQAIVVEGVGGWRVPLSDSLQQRDLARLLEIPVVLVVGLRLGCISHARLTAEAVMRDGLPLQGWIANHTDPDYDSAVETLDYLAAVMEVPMIGEFPFRNDDGDEKGARKLNLGFLM